MKKTTLCYIRHEDEYLMLYRNKKKNDLNEGFWIGFGGKVEPGESETEGAIREIWEETGMTVSEDQMVYVGLIHFISDKWEDEDMYLYEVYPGYKAENVECNEGTAEWVQIKKLSSLPMWEGDRIFMDKMLAGETGFEMSLEYKGTTLVNYSISL